MPQFLTPPDYHRLLKAELLEQLTGGDATLTDEAERVALSEVRAYLFPLFDADALFAQTGTERHPMLVNCVADMALYHLFARVNPAAMPALRTERYAAAQRWLQAVQAGTLQPGFPPRLDADDNPLPDVRAGGLPKRDLTGF